MQGTFKFSQVLADFLKVNNLFWPSHGKDNPIILNGYLHLATLLCPHPTPFLPEQTIGPSN